MTQRHVGHFRCRDPPNEFVVVYNDKMFKDNGTVHILSKNQSGRARGARIEENFAENRDSEPLCARSVSHSIADNQVHSTRNGFYRVQATPHTAIQTKQLFMQKFGDCVISF